MKLLHSTREVVVPEGLSLEVKARQVRVKGPRGEHIRSQSRPPACLRAPLDSCGHDRYQEGSCIGQRWWRRAESYRKHEHVPPALEPSSSAARATAATERTAAMLSKRPCCTLRGLPWGPCRCVQPGSRGGSGQQRQQQHRACLLHGGCSCMAPTAACPATGRAAAPSLPAGCSNRITRIAQCAQAGSSLGLHLQRALSVMHDLAGH